MDARIQAISCDPFFAGNPDLPSKLEWVRTGDSFMLVQKSLPQQISLVPAKIRLVGSIPSGFSSLTDHLVWSRAQRYPLCKYTGIAVLDAGDVALAKMLWDPCKIGLARLQDLLDVEGGVSTVGNDGTVTIQHCLFENIKDMDRYVITQDLDVVEPQIIPVENDLFSFGNWPVRSKVVEDELEQLKRSKRYNLSPLPLFDILGGLVAPSDYVVTLTGALVCVDVVLSYRETGFVADVDHIQVLRNALPLERSLTKRRMPLEKNLTNKRHENS